MKPSLDSIVQESTVEFLQYRTQKYLESFHSYSGALYRYIDPRTDRVCYGGPEAGWAYNYDISGIMPPQINGYSHGQSGLAYDFINGRFSFDSGFPNIQLSGSFTTNEVNFYLANQSAAQIIFEDNYQRSPVLNSATGYLQPYNYIVPAVFVKSFRTENEPYSLGGKDWSLWRYQVICLMPDEQYLAAIGGMIRDVNQCVFPILQNFPINQYGDLKDLTWNYPDFSDNDYYGYISDSTFKIEEPDVFTAENPKLYLGIGYVEVRMVRQPRDPGKDPQIGFTIPTTDIDYDFDTDIDNTFILN